MKEVCAQKEPFNLKLSGLGTFSGKDYVRVLWLGIAGEMEKLRSLQKEIDRELDKIGFPKEKREYRPHVTIGQDIVFKEDFDLKEFQSRVKDYKIGKVDRIYLYKSEQINNKRIYTKVSEYILAV